MFTEPEDFSSAQLDGIQILDDKMYSHKLVRLNYTSYNLRREQDCINPLKRPDIMVLAPEWDNSGPFWFARVIEIFHVNARYVGPNSTRANRKWQRVELLWVRWFTLDTTQSSGFQHRRQHQVHFVDANDPDNVPFGFIDPDDVIRAAYLPPCDDLLGPSKLARKLPIADEVDETQDYAYLQGAMCVLYCLSLPPRCEPDLFCIGLRTATSSGGTTAGTLATEELVLTSKRRASTGSVSLPHATIPPTQTTSHSKEVRRITVYMVGIKRTRERTTATWTIQRGLGSMTRERRMRTLKQKRTFRWQLPRTPRKWMRTWTRRCTTSSTNWRRTGMMWIRMPTPKRTVGAARERATQTLRSACVSRTTRTTRTTRTAMKTQISRTT